MKSWGSAPIILVFADSDEGAAAASRSVEAAGGRVAASTNIDTATQRLDEQAAVDLVWVDIGIDHGPVLDRLLDRLVDGSSNREFAVMIVISPQLVDIVAARISGDAVSILVGRDEAMLEAALGERLSRPALQFHEDGGDEAMSRRRFQRDAFRSRSASVLRDGGGGSDDGDFDPHQAGPAGTADANAIREIIRARRLREDLFGDGLFADPAWDILLDLMAARIEGRSVAVSSLCIAAAVPATTALRWIKQLTEAGLLHRVADPDDGRRVFIELTDHAETAMAAYFAAVRPGSRG